MTEINESVKLNDILTEDEQQPEKPKRRRRSKKDSTIDSFTVTDDVFSTDLIAGFIRIPFDFIASRHGDYWKLRKDEEKTIANLASKVATKRLPAILADYAEEVALGFALGFALYTRYMIYLDEKNKVITEDVKKNSSIFRQQSS